MNALKKTKLFPLPGISAAWNTFNRSWLLAFKIACTKRTFSCLYRNLIHSASFHNSRMLPGDSTESYIHGVTNQFGTLHCVMLKHSCFSRPLSNGSCFTFPSVEARPCRTALYVTSLRFATGEIQVLSHSDHCGTYSVTANSVWLTAEAKWREKIWRRKLCFSMLFDCCTYLINRTSQLSSDVVYTEVC